MIDVVLAAEKSGYIDVNSVEKLIEGLAGGLSRSEAARLGLVVYASQALPMLDLTLDVARIPRAYREAPLLPGSPNPMSALREAADMLNDYSDPLTLRRAVLLVWSAKSRPRPSLRFASIQLLSMGVDLLVLLPMHKPPVWARKYFGDARVYLLRGTSNPYRLGDKIAQDLINAIKY